MTTLSAISLFCRLPHSWKLQMPQQTRAGAAQDSPFEISLCRSRFFFPPPPRKLQVLAAENSVEIASERGSEWIRHAKATLHDLPAVTGERGSSEAQISLPGRRSIRQRYTGSWKPRDCGLGRLSRHPAGVAGHGREPDVAAPA